MQSWIIAVLIIAGITVLIMVIRRRKTHKKHELYVNEHYGRWNRLSAGQLQLELHRVKNRKEELQHRLNAFGRAGSSSGNDSYDSIESQMSSIRWKLEKLDIEEDDIRRAIGRKIR